MESSRTELYAARDPDPGGWSPAPTATSTPCRRRGPGRWAAGRRPSTPSRPPGGGRDGHRRGAPSASPWLSSVSWLPSPSSPCSSCPRPRRRSGQRRATARSPPPSGPATGTSCGPGRRRRPTGLTCSPAAPRSRSTACPGSGRGSPSPARAGRLRRGPRPHRGPSALLTGPGWSPRDRALSGGRIGSTPVTLRPVGIGERPGPGAESPGHMGGLLLEVSRRNRRRAGPSGQSRRRSVQHVRISC